MKHLLSFSLFEANNITSEDWAGNWQELPQWKLLLLMGFKILGTNSKGSVSINSPHSDLVFKLTSNGYVRTKDDGYVYKTGNGMPGMLDYLIKKFVKKAIDIIPTNDLDALMKAKPEMLDVLSELPKIKEKIISRIGISDPTEDSYIKHGLTTSVVNWLNRSMQATSGKIGTWKLNKTTGEIDIIGSFGSTSKSKSGFRGIKFGVVSGDFTIRNAGLTSLDGAPREIGGDFDCSFNQLTSLKEAPESIGKDFNCSGNQLTSLEGAPLNVGKNFYCGGNQLTSLKEAPQTVGGSFDCSGNQLTSLKEAPKTVGKDFICVDNPLTSLEGAPESVGRFGISMWNSDPSIRTLDWNKGWSKKGDAEFTKTLISKLKEINALGSGANKGKPISMLISLANSVVLSDMLEYLLSLRSSTSDKFEIYGAIKASMPDVWDKIKDEVDPDGATSDLIDLGF
jgi:hypothetical protein